MSKVEDADDNDRQVADMMLSAHFLTIQRRQ